MMPNEFAADRQIDSWIFNAQSTVTVIIRANSPPPRQVKCSCNSKIRTIVYTRKNNNNNIQLWVV